MAEDAVNRVGRRYGVAANDDGASLWQYRQVPLSAERFLRAAVDRMAGADLLCWGVGNTRFWYGSNVTEDLDTGQQVFPTVQEWMAHTTLRSLRASGQEPLALVCGRCHRHGMHLYASLRMNDGHFSFPPPAAPDFGVPHPDQLWNHQRGAQASPLTSEFWRRHPEYRIGENWPGSAFSADLLDYAHAEVRAWWLGVITDIAARFEIDGVELDFMRNPFFFHPARAAAGRPLMTAFVREVREVLDEAGRRRGRHLGLAARCPTSLAGCDVIGLDVETWVRDGLVDVLIPSPTRTNKFETDLRPLAAISRGTDCQVLAGVDTVMPNQTWEQVRALQAEDRPGTPPAADPAADADDESTACWRRAGTGSRANAACWRGCPSTCGGRLRPTPTWMRRTASTCSTCGTRSPATAATSMEPSCATGALRKRWPAATSCTRWTSTSPAPGSATRRRIWRSRLRCRWC